MQSIRKRNRGLIRGAIVLVFVYSLHGFMYLGGESTPQHTGELKTQSNQTNLNKIEKESYIILSFDTQYNDILLLEEYHQGISPIMYQRTQDNKGVLLKKHFSSEKVKGYEGISDLIQKLIKTNKIKSIENLSERNDGSVSSSFVQKNNSYLMTLEENSGGKYSSIEFNKNIGDFLSKENGYMEVTETTRTKFCEGWRTETYTPSICGSIEITSTLDKNSPTTIKQHNSGSTGSLINGEECSENSQCGSDYCNTTLQDSHMISFGGSSYSTYTSGNETGEDEQEKKKENTENPLLGGGERIGLFGAITKPTTTQKKTYLTQSFEGLTSLSAGTNGSIHLIPGDSGGETTGNMGHKIENATSAKDAATNFIKGLHSASETTTITSTSTGSNDGKNEYHYKDEQTIGESTYVYFTSSYKGIPREGTGHTVVVSGKDTITQAITQSTKLITLETSPSLSETEILNINHIDKDKVNTKLTLLEVPINEEETTDRLTYKVTDPEIDLVTHYDAHTGELIHRYLTRFFETAEIRADVTTYGNQKVPGINYGGGQTSKDGKTGDISQARIQLKSDTSTFPVSVMYNAIVPEKTYPTNAVIDITNLQKQSVNMYRHMKRMTDILDKYFPNFTGWDNKRAKVYVSSKPYCNAYYNGSINMFAETSECNDGSLHEDILYHEFGHGINDVLYGGVGNGAIHEGFADVFSYAATEDLQLGEGRFKNGRIVRDYNNPVKYNKMSGEAHADGQPIAGAFITLAQKIGLTDMMTIFEKLMFLRLDTATCYPHCDIGTTQALFRKMFDATINITKDNNTQCNAVRESFTEMGIPSNSFSSNPCSGSGNDNGNTNNGGTDAGGSNDSDDGGGNDDEDDNEDNDGNTNNGGTDAGGSNNSDDGGGNDGGTCKNDSDCSSYEYCKKGSFTDTKIIATPKNIISSSITEETELDPYTRSFGENTITVKYKENSFQYFKPFDTNKDNASVYIKSLSKANIGFQVLSNISTLQENSFKTSSTTLAQAFQSGEIVSLDRPLENFVSDYDRATNIYELTTSSSHDVKNIVSQLTTDPNVEYVESGEIRVETTTTNDTHLGSQRDKLGKSKNKGGINTIQAIKIAGSKATGNIYIGINDSGVTASHEDLKTKMSGGGSDSHGHGTHVAGLAAAAGNNNTGVLGNAGTAPNVKILECGTFGNIPSCVNEIKKLGTGVVNMSRKYTSSRRGSGDIDAIRAANAAGIVMVAAAGNDFGSSNNIYPCAYDGVVCVASTTSSNRKSSFSNSGSNVDLSAPGSNVLSTCNNGRYCEMSGTSMASPNAAGAIAYLMALGASGTEAVSLLKSTAIDVGSGMGAGRIDLCNAVVKLLGTGTCTGSEEPNPGDGGGDGNDGGDDGGGNDDSEGVCTPRGNNNSGDSNSGDSNSGDSNSGDSNSGDSNSGNSNSGDSNSGDSNSGDSNSGDSNSGDSNSGDSNSGGSNSGGGYSGCGLGYASSSECMSHGCPNQCSVLSNGAYYCDNCEDGTGDNRCGLGYYTKSKCESSNCSTGCDEKSGARYCSQCSGGTPPSPTKKERCDSLIKIYGGKDKVHPDTRKEVCEEFYGPQSSSGSTTSGSTTSGSTTSGSTTGSTTAGGASGSTNTGQVPTYDCPSINKNKGDTCDDNNSLTRDDRIQNNCLCSGTQSEGNNSGEGSEDSDSGNEGSPPPSTQTTCLEPTDTCDCRITQVQGSCLSNNKYDESQLVQCRQECKDKESGTTNSTNTGSESGDNAEAGDGDGEGDADGEEKSEGSGTCSPGGPYNKLSDCEFNCGGGTCDAMFTCSCPIANIDSFSVESVTQSLSPKRGICTDKPSSVQMVDSYIGEYGHLPSRYLLSRGKNNDRPEFLADESTSSTDHDIRIVHTSNTNNVQQGGTIQHKIVVKYVSYSPHLPLASLDIDVAISSGLTLLDDKSQLTFDAEAGTISTTPNSIQIPLNILTSSRASSQDIFSQTYLGTVIFETIGNTEIQDEESIVVTVGCYGYRSTSGTSMKSSECSGSTSSKGKIIAKQIQSTFSSASHGSGDSEDSSTTNGTSTGGNGSSSSSGNGSESNEGATTGSTNSVIGLTTGGTSTGTSGSTGSSSTTSTSGGGSGSTGNDSGSTTPSPGTGTTGGSPLPLPKQPDPVCGNGIIEAGESCDDKNTKTDDGCSNKCYEEMNRSCKGSPSSCKEIPTVARELTTIVQKEIPNCSNQEVDYSKINFDDINDSSWKSSILALQHYCVSKGTGGDLSTFDPERRVSKAEFIKLLSKTMLLGSNHAFVPEGTEIEGVEVIDIPKDHRAAQYVKIAQQAGLLDALSKKYFNGLTLTPNESITQKHVTNTFSKIEEGAKLSTQDIERILGSTEYPTRGMIAELLVKKFIGSFEQYLVMQGKNKKYYGEIVSELQDKPQSQQITLLTSKIESIKKMKDEEFSSEGYTRFWILYLLEKIEKKFS